MKKFLIGVLVLLVLVCVVACNDTGSIACPECGYENSSDVKFCSDCGAAMSSSNNDNSHNGGNNGSTSCQHSFGEWQEKASADCTNAGTKERACSKCSHKETETIVALGHTTTTGVCGRCNQRMGWTKEEAQSLIKVYSAYVDDINSAGGVDLKIGWENTSNKELKYVYFTVEAYNSVWDKAYCEIRDHNAFTGRTIGPFAPGYNNLYYSSFDDTYTPTSVWEECYYNHTIKYFVLTQVRLVYMDESEITINGDAVEYVLCDYPSELKYSWSNDYNGYKVEYHLKKNFNGQKMSIPSTYNGSPVTALGYRAFENMKFSSVEIPNSIKYIGSSAFQGCSNLREVVIPNGVEVIDSFAFDSCTSLSKVTIPKSVAKIESYAFSKCSNFEIVFEGTPEEWDRIDKDSYWSYNTNMITFTFKPSSQGGTASGNQELPTKLRVGFSPDYAPFSYIDGNGNLIGFDKEYITEIAKLLGYQTTDIEFIKVNQFDDLFTGLSAGTYDLIISGIVETEERNQYYISSNPYVSYTVTIIGDEVLDEPFIDEYVIYGIQNQYLIDQINLAIQTLESNGTADSLVEEWLEN